MCSFSVEAEEKDVYSFGAVGPRTYGYSPEKKNVEEHRTYVQALRSSREVLKERPKSGIQILIDLGFINLRVIQNYFEKTKLLEDSFMNGEVGVDVNKIQLAGRKAIHFAADCGQLEVLEFLIHIGAEINAPDVHGFTALLSAIYEGHLECVKLLVSKGADKTAKSPEGMSYLEVAESPEMRELLK
ncbi:myotrophin [Heptranchias perlo]|uniref:myotrophin n=1 Tax=Heptranchias perlo TaxID=212740 RepID=UPI00355A85F3